MSGAGAKVATPASRSKVRLELRGEQETLVIPLYAKALDFRSRHPVLGDAKANELVESLDYDFERLRSPGSANLLVVRARQIDEWAREFLARHPDALVLNLGCGLDTRVSRLAPSPATTAWLDVDLPDVIALRRNFYADGPGYRMLAASVTDGAWLAPFPAERPVLVLADGVLEYLPESDVQSLFRRITGRFRAGELIFDVMNSYALRTGNERLEGRTEARLRWAVDDVRAVDALDPRLRRTGHVPLLASPFVPWRYRPVLWIASVARRFRTSVQLLRYEF